MAILDVKQSGGSYSTLASALSSANAGDTISIEGSWTVDDTNGATIADDNLTIQTDASSMHPGYWDETQQHYRLDISSSGAHSLTLDGSYTATIDGLAIQYSGSGNSRECFRCMPGTSDAVTIKNSILYQTGSHGDSDCLYIGYNSSFGTVTLENCVVHGAPRKGLHSQTGSGSGQININSCVFWDNDVGIEISGSTSGLVIDMHNSVLCGNTTTDFSGSTSEVFGCSYSIDSDNSIAGSADSGTGRLASRTITDNVSPGAGDWVIVEDITSAPYDLRLVDNAENDAQDMHSTATAHSLTIPSTDIAGTSRPQNTDYDCGPFEITGGTTLQGSVTDGIDFSETLASQATFAGVVADGIDFSEVLARQATFSASISDGIGIGESVGKQATYPVVSTDGFDLSDIASIAKLLLGSAADGIVFTDIDSVAAYYYANSTDGISFSEALQNTAVYQSYITDGIEASDIVAALALFSAESVDGIDFSDSTTYISTILSNLFDGFVMSDVSAARSDLSSSLSDGFILTDLNSVQVSFTGAAVDDLMLSDTIAATAILAAISADGIIFSEALIGDLSGFIQALAQDGLLLSDSASVGAQLLALVTDAFDLSESVIPILTMLAQVADGLDLGSASAAGAILVAQLTDGIELGDLTSAQITAAVIAGSILDGIVFNDVGQVDATFDVSVSDAIVMSDVVNTLVRFATIASDGLILSDVAFHFVASGEVTITFTVRQGKITFIVRQPAATFESRQPAIRFTRGEA